jgi:hypothetical protein
MVTCFSRIRPAQKAKEIKEIKLRKLRKAPADTPPLMQKKKSRKDASNHASVEASAYASRISCTTLCFD